MSKCNGRAARKASKGGRKSEKEKEKKEKEERERLEKEEKEKEKKVATAAKKEKTATGTPVVTTVSVSSVVANEKSSANSSPATEPKRKRPRIDPTTVENVSLIVVISVTSLPLSLCWCLSCLALSYFMCTSRWLYSLGFAPSTCIHF